MAGALVKKMGDRKVPVWLSTWGSGNAVAKLRTMSTQKHTSTNLPAEKRQGPSRFTMARPSSTPTPKTPRVPPIRCLWPIVSVNLLCSAVKHSARPFKAAWVPPDHPAILLPKLRTMSTQKHTSTNLSSSQFNNNYFAEMWSGSEEGSYLRPIDFVYHSTLGLRAMKKKHTSTNLPASKRQCEA